MLKLPSGRTLYYGKGDVLAYRTYAAPLKVNSVPESAYAGDPNVIFAHNVKFAVSSEELLTSFTEGDNGRVVATDSMKNFILRQSAEFEGSTTEAYVAFLSRRFFDTYSHIGSIEISADRIPFQRLSIPAPGGFADSELVYRPSHNDRASVSMSLVRTPEGVQIGRHWCGLSDLQLIKVSGSSFYGFIRDEYTTLPDSYDRPLFIFLDIKWRYAVIEDGLDPERGRYAAAEHIRDIAHTVFHEFETPSIQHLIWLIGQRVLTRFPQLAEIRFESNNRTWETFVESENGTSPGVYTEPRPPYGFQGFSMTRADLAGAPVPEIAR